MVARKDARVHSGVALMLLLTPMAACSTSQPPPQPQLGGALSAPVLGPLPDARIDGVTPVAIAPSTLGRCEVVERVALAGTDVVVELEASATSNGLVCRILRATQPIYPYDCERRALPALCGADQDSTNLREKGCDLVLVDRDERASTHRLLFSGTCRGNTMCATFGFWMLTVTPVTVIASPPIFACNDLSRLEQKLNPRE